MLHVIASLLLATTAESAVSAAWQNMFVPPRAVPRLEVALQGGAHYWPTPFGQHTQATTLSMRADYYVRPTWAVSPRFMTTRLPTRDDPLKVTTQALALETRLGWLSWISRWRFGLGLDLGAQRRSTRLGQSVSDSAWTPTVGAGAGIAVALGGGRGRLGADISVARLSGQWHPQLLMEIGWLFGERL